MQLTKSPPRLLSDLIELAIDDARKLDRKRYKPTFETWHEPQWHLKDKTCLVCLAGAVIASTLECATTTQVRIAPAADRRLGAFSFILTSRNEEQETSGPLARKNWENTLWALDAVRNGHWNEAVRKLNGMYPNKANQERLDTLHRPDQIMFNSWESFDKHLSSLAERAERLRSWGF